MHVKAYVMLGTCGECVYVVCMCDCECECTIDDICMWYCGPMLPWGARGLSK